MADKLIDQFEKNTYTKPDEYLNGWAKKTGWKAAVVYDSLWRHASKTGKSFPSIRLMAEEFNISPRTVLRGLEKLIEYNLVKKKKVKDKKTGKFLKNIYILTDKNQWIDPLDSNLVQNQVTESHLDKNHVTDSHSAVQNHVTVVQQKYIPNILPTSDLGSERSGKGKSMFYQKGGKEYFYNANKSEEQSLEDFTNKVVALYDKVWNRRTLRPEKYTPLVKKALLKGHLPRDIGKAIENAYADDHYSGRSEKWKNCNLVWILEINSSRDNILKLSTLPPKSVQMR